MLPNADLQYALPKMRITLISAVTEFIKYSLKPNSGVDNHRVSGLK